MTLCDSPVQEGGESQGDPHVHRVGPSTDRRNCEATSDRGSRDLKQRMSVQVCGREALGFGV